VLDMPAADPYVIAVGATDTASTPDPADDRVADFSSRSALRGPDVVAPGTGVVSVRVPGSTLDEEFPGARVGDGFFRGSGTSQAAAVVSGLAARLLAQRPELTPELVEALLRRGAVDLPDPASADGAGRVDVARSEALPTPGPEAVQRWALAAPDLKRLFKRGNRRLETGATNWSGRRWSGMKWSGRRWSGMKWAGMKWSGAAWDAP
jgi:serine protease AprX